MADPIRINDRRGVILNFRLEEASEEIKSALRKATKEATDILHKEIVAKTPKRTGEAVKSIKKEFDSEKITGSVLSTGKGGGGILGFVNVGTAPRVQKSTGRKTGRMPANPYWRQAAIDKREEMLGKFKNIL